MPVIEWHPSPNYSSRGGRKSIAIVDNITAGSYPGCLVMPEAQYQALLWLHRKLIKEHGIPVGTDHIIGHYRLA